jgi:hypothetical protein
MRQMLNGALVMLASFVSAPVAAYAQDKTPAPIVRQLKDRTPPGAPATPIEAAPVRWDEVRAQIALTARRDLAASQTVAAAVSAPSGLRAMEPRRIKSVSLREVAASRTPVLVPIAPGVDSTLRVFAQPDSYSATADLSDGVAMRISGSRRKLLVGDIRPARERLAALKSGARLPSVDASYLITRSDSSTDLSFSKFGCGYVLSLMCDDPADAKCADDSYIASIASSMVILNAEAGEGQ